jgi:hypothetical protein
MKRAHAPVFSMFAALVTAFEVLDVNLAAFVCALIGLWF